MLDDSNKDNSGQNAHCTDFNYLYDDATFVYVVDIYGQS